MQSPPPVIAAGSGETPKRNAPWRKSRPTCWATFCRRTPSRPRLDGRLGAAPGEDQLERAVTAKATRAKRPRRTEARRAKPTALPCIDELQHVLRAASPRLEIGYFAGGRRLPRHP